MPLEIANLSKTLILVINSIINFNINLLNSKKYTITNIKYEYSRRNPKNPEFHSRGSLFKDKKRVKNEIKEKLRRKWK